MMDFIVDKTKCLGCGACVKDCPADAIEMSGGVPDVARFGEKLCIRCQHCLAVCPTGAVSVCGVKPEMCVGVGRKPRPEEVEALLKSRRTCRQYKREAVSKAKLEKLREVLNWSPTGCNSRAMHFSVVEGMETMDGIRATVTRTLLDAIKGDTLPPEMKELRLCRPMLERGVDLVFRGAPHLIVAAPRDNAPCATIDPVIALAQFEVMAQSLGLGTTWCGFAYGLFRGPCSEVRETLRIPDGYSVSYVMLFGEPAVDYPRTTVPEPFSMAVID